MLDRERMPRHVAIIMDGNGRWAKKHGVPRLAGHNAGMESMKEIVRCASNLGIQYLTVYAFSTENWKRSQEEVGGIFKLLTKFVDLDLDELNEENVRVKCFGDYSVIPPKAKKSMDETLSETADNTGMQFNIALNYGGRAELVRAAKALAGKVKSGELEPDAIDEAAFAGELYTAGQPDVDLLIRTSGEMRLSNFLPWQTAYTEMVFEKTYWPDYDRAAYLNSLRAYSMRKRRFGNA